MVARAIRLLKRGEPLPLDLVYGLLNKGVDVSYLERKYAE